MATVAAAAPFETTVGFTQPDGAVIELRGKGDDFYAVFETLDGYTVTFDPATKAYYYAGVSADGESLLRSALTVGVGDPAQLGLAKHLRISRDAVAAQAAERYRAWDDALGVSTAWQQKKATLRAIEDANAKGIAYSPPSTTTVGLKVGVCLLIDFSDDPATIAQTNVFDYCNGDSYSGYGNNGSVKKYFYDNSNGLLTYTNIVTAYIRMDHPKAYYNDTSKGCGTQGNLLITNAIALMKALPNYATEIAPVFSNLTLNASSIAVACNVFYAGGNGGVWSYGLWPHSGGLGVKQELVSGVYVQKYQLTNIGSSLAISTFCHENGHMLCGFPDIYDYEYDSMGGAGSFCLMDYGTSGSNPCQICAYLKRAAGWATTVDLTSSSVLAANLNSSGDGFNRFYRYLKPGVTTEYYLLENRQKKGRDSGIPAAGIAIWHIDESGNKDNQSLAYNTTHANYEVTLVQADNKWHFQKDSNSGDTNDLYYSGNSVAGYLNRFNDTTEPKARWWNGTASGINFSSFSANGTNMTFDISPAGLTIVSLSPLTNGVVGVPYSRTLLATNIVAGSITCTWAVVSNALPSGLALSAGGVLSGTPTVVTNSVFLVAATSGDGAAATNQFSLETYARRTLPFFENFDAKASMPTNWAQEYGTGTTDWTVRNGSSGGYPSAAYSGSYNAWFYIGNNNSTGRKTKLVTPMLDLGVSPGTVTLRFWECKNVRSPSYQDYLYIYYRTNSTAGWNLLASYTTNVTSWTQRTLTLPNPTRTYLVAFDGTANYGYGTCVDDVLITSTSSDPIITTASLLPTGYVGVAYSQALSVSGGAPPYSWSLVSNTLPTGLSMSTNGVVVGTPVARTNQAFRISVTDSVGRSATNDFNVAVSLPVGTTLYVNAAQPDDGGDGLSWATAKRTIQGAADAAVDGCVVLVTNGVYNSGVTYYPSATNANRLVLTYALTVRSVNGAAATVIEGSGTNFYGTPGAIRCVAMTKGRLEGFTLRKGATLAASSSSGYGAGVYSATTSAEIRNCLITENLAYYGGGCYGGVLTDCTFATNRASNGGGAYGSTLTNCTFYGNRATSVGGGSYQGTLNCCTLSGNSSSNGGGSYYGTLRNCLLTGNTSPYGGGAYYSTLYNCTLKENATTTSGGGTYGGTLYNCIVWGNKLGSATNDAVSGTWYNTCASGLAATNGCIKTDPLFVAAANGNCRLQAFSPCIDKGSNALASGQSDLDGKPRIVDGDGDGTATVDMGAYELAVAPVTIASSGGNTAVAEGGVTDSYSVTLNLQPSDNVTFTVNAGPQLSVSPTSLTFTAETWILAQTVTVSAVDDAVSEGLHTGTVTHAATSADPNYNGIAVPSVTVTITDNDPQRLEVSTNSVTVIEGSATNITVRLAAQPMTNVTVMTAWLSGDADLRVSAGSNLTFTAGNWSVAQTVALSAAEDNADTANGVAQFGFSALGCSSVTVTVTEADDDFTLTVNSAGNGTANGGGIKDRDNSPFAISATPNSGFSFFVWTGPDAAKVANTNGAITTITTVSAASVTATFVIAPGVIVTPSGGSTAVTEGEGGPSDTYTVALSTRPGTNVTVTVCADAQLSASPTSLTFTAENWIMAQTVTVSAVDDAVPGGTHTRAVTHAVSSADTNYNGIAVASVTVTITDNDPADMNVTWDAGGGNTFINTLANWNIDANPAFDGSITFNFGSAGGTATVNTNVSFRGLAFSRDADFTVAGGGGTLTLGAGGLRAAVPTSISRVYTLSPDIVLSADQNWGVTNNGAGVTALIVSGPVSDGASAFGIVKSGDGVLTLAGDNRYDGLTTIAAGGALRVTHANALGSTNGATSVASNGWVEISGSINVAEPLTVGDSGAGGALRSTDGTNVLSGRVTQTAPSRIRALAGSRLTLAGGVSGGAAVYLTPDVGAELALAGGPVNVGSTGKVCANGAGLVTLGVAGNTFGTLEVAGLTVRTALPDVLPAATILAIGAAYSPNGTFDLSGNRQTVSQLKRGTTGAGTRLVTTVAPATLTVSGSASSTYDGLLTGALSLVKSGTSILTLIGTNTYTGTTVISGGTLYLSAGASLGGSHDIAVTGSGTLSVQTGTDGLADAAVLSIADGGNAKVFVKAGVVEAVGALYLGGHRKGAGTWGASSLTAQNVDTEHFAGTGAISVPDGFTVSPVPVPFAWVDQHPLLLSLTGGDYDAAALADADGDGHVAWQEYVSGSNPTNSESVLRALLILSNGVPQITWMPDLGTARVYTVEGKTNLTGSVWGTTNDVSHFFRVKVGMP